MVEIAARSTNCTINEIQKILRISDTVRNEVTDIARRGKQLQIIPEIITNPILTQLISQTISINNHDVTCIFYSGDERVAEVQQLIQQFNVQNETTIGESIGNTVQIQKDL